MISLPKQHMINSLLDEHHSQKATSYCIATCYLIPKQHMKIKSSIIDINNYLNGIFLAFDSLNQELSPGFCLIDTFPNHFSFYLANCKNTDTKITHQNKLKNIYKSSSNNQDTILIIVMT